MGEKAVSNLLVQILAGAAGDWAYEASDDSANWKDATSVLKAKIQRRAVGNQRPRREDIRRRSDGAVMPGGQSGEMASGAHNLVLRNVRAAPIS
jgi:hypothetical protein